MARVWYLALALIEILGGPSGMSSSLPVLAQSAVEGWRSRPQTSEVASSFLLPIAQQSGLSPQAMITVCDLARHCLHLRGDSPPVSAASLIKVPIAVALMNKVTTEGISLETPVYVDRGNFTEDSAEIRVGKSYPLRTLLVQMIARSSNIATNQLIDYLGQDYINRVLRSRGYSMIQVNRKLMGATILPANPGQGLNRLTSDELTALMTQIYNQEHSGDDVLIDALRRQGDRSLGFAALQGSSASWLGEKTGQNSRVLGTTVALAIGGRPYVMTVIDNRSHAEPNIRRCITRIVHSLARLDPLDSPAP